MRLSICWTLAFSVAVVATLTTSALGAQASACNASGAPVLPGVEVLLRDSLASLRGQRVGLITNHSGRDRAGTSTIDLLARAPGVRLAALYGPEHGIRGTAQAGATIANSVDSATGVPIFSLYGATRVPTAAMLANIDVLIYDIQDVGARFYTYINTLDHVMEACAANNKELLILDRPNPNGYVVDGPILEDHLRSGIGMHRIPIAHGMTIAEFAQLINGEGWLPNKANCKLRIVKVTNYTHATPYTLPVLPSPNLNTQQSVLLYPSICLFEGTILSQGRGTYIPFTVLGAPALKSQYAFSFKPVSLKGMSETPLHQDADCYGLDLRQYDTKKLRKSGQLNLSWLMELYKAYPEKDRFFDRSYSKQMGDFNKLAGTENLKKQIIAGTPEANIRKSWEPGLSNFRKTRKQYLLYP